MFKKILICNDLSDSSNLIIGCSGNLKSIGVEEAIIVHAVYNASQETYESHKENKTKSILTKQKAVLEEQGIKTSISIVQGAPAEAINDAAEKLNVSAIFMGTHGKGILKRTALGSVSSEVIHITKKPVFLIKTNIESNDEVSLSCKNIFKHILYLTDFSETAEKALEYIEKIVMYSKCPVSVLHIQNHDKRDLYGSQNSDKNVKIFAEVRAQHEKKIYSDLISIKNRLEKAGSSKVDIDFPSGRPIDVVIGTARKNEDLSIIIMGSQGKGFFKEMFLGSLSLQVSRYSPIPVLLIPARV